MRLRNVEKGENEPPARSILPGESGNKEGMIEAMKDNRKQKKWRRSGS
ncbi:hypothetical protein [Candidatus Burkholderia verschuerenii]|nr:hypothetical protein [Candidatus Burkholderia verschuerenii]